MYTEDEESVFIFGDVSLGCKSHGREGSVGEGSGISAPPVRHRGSQAWDEYSRDLGFHICRKHTNDSFPPSLEERMPSHREKQKREESAHPCEV